MPLYDQVELLCQAIAVQGRQEADQLLQAAQKQADRLVSAEEDRHRDLVRRTREEVQAQALLEARNRMDRASLESKRRIAEAKETMLAQVFEDGLARLGQFRQSPEYPAWLRRMLAKTLEELTGDRIAVAAHPEEARWLTPDLLAEVGQEAGCRLEFNPAADVPAGGFIAVRGDGRVRFDVTFQGIINRSRERLRTGLARRLWSEP